MAKFKGPTPYGYKMEPKPCWEIPPHPMHSHCFCDKPDGHEGPHHCTIASLCKREWSRVVFEVTLPESA